MRNSEFRAIGMAQGSHKVLWTAVSSCIFLPAGMLEWVYPSSHPNVIQVYGTINSGGLHATIFYGGTHIISSSVANVY